MCLQNYNYSKSFSLVKVVIEQSVIVVHGSAAVISYSYKV